MGPISNFLPPVSCDSLVLQGLRCEWGAGVLNLVLSLSHNGHWKFNMAPHGKELSGDLKKRIVALHKDSVGYRKIARPWNWDAARWLRPYSDLTGQVPLKTGLAMVDQRSWVHVHIQRLCLGNRRMSAASIAAEVEGVGGSDCQCSHHTPHTTSNWFVWLLSQKEASSKDDAQESPQKVCWRQAD